MKTLYKIAACALFFGLPLVAGAVPAKKGKFKKVLPDGTVVTLERHGDEFFHWTTLEDGTVVSPDADGYYKPSSMPTSESFGGRLEATLQAAAIRARRAASASASVLTRASAKTYHFPVILVQFSDKEFSVSNPQQAFYNLLNQRGYSDNGATGSVYDYYLENSMGAFVAEFDVYGPVTLSGSVSDYGTDVTYPYNDGSGDNAAKALYLACKSLDSSIDFSKYDNDGDGEVDMVFMYYAGYNEAEGADESTIWPHKWSFAAYDNYNRTSYSSTKFDNKTINTYACTSELKGTSGADMCGIGTCAHEFSHTQGLPDFYDTNYTTDGEAGATYSYDIMCSGSYNNEGRTPPYFNAEERIMMGWLSGYETLSTSENIIIPSVDNNVAYKLPTANTTGGGEYFIFECRSGQGWDSYVEPGLIVYHVDKSTKYSFTISSSTSYTGYQAWNTYTSYINASGSHPCFYIIPAVDPECLNFAGSEAKLPFPGAQNVDFLTPADWSGATYGLFSDITFAQDGSQYGSAYSGEAVVVLSYGPDHKGIKGLVKNSSGEPLEGATVNIYSSSSESSSNAPQKISGRVIENLKMSVTTDEKGSYTLDLSALSASTVDIEVVAGGYVTKYESIGLEDYVIAKNFTLRGINEPVDRTVKKFDLSDGSIYLLGYGSTCTSYASIMLSADDLKPYVGRKITRLGFAYTMDEGSTVSSVYGIIDFGNTRKLTSKVASPEYDSWNVIDVSGENLVIPADTDCYFGYGLVQCTYGYPWLYSNYYPKDGGLNYYLTTGTSVSTSAFTWNSLSVGNLLVYIVVDDTTDVDYNYIYNPGYGTYTVGDNFELKLIEAEGDRKPGTAIEWFFDDEPVSGDSITLAYAGYHLVEARFTTVDGKTKVVELEMNVGL